MITHIKKKIKEKKMLKIIIKDKNTNKKINTLNSYGELANCLTDGDWDRIFTNYSKRDNPGVKIICEYLNCYKDEPYKYSYYYTK